MRRLRSEDREIIEIADRVEIETNCRIEIRIEYETTRKVTIKAKAENKINTNYLSLLFFFLEDRILFFSFFSLFPCIIDHEVISHSYYLNRVVIDRSFEELNHSDH